MDALSPVKRRRPPFDRTNQRLLDMETVIRERSVVVPDTDDADLYLVPVAQHFRVQAHKRHDLIFKNPSGQARYDLSSDGQVVEDLLRNWSNRWAPHATVAQLHEAAVEACRAHRLPKADTLGKLLRLSYADRQAWGITTIGSYDVTKSQRSELSLQRKREQDRESKKNARAKQGRKPRPEYEANSLSRTRPWEKLSISRATYYRRHRTPG
jgi:hypothetical protein